MKSDIQSQQDIKEMVNHFYAQVRVDALLGGIFNGVIRNRWTEHLEKMYRFWETVLLDKHTYQGSPFLPHAHMPVSEEHFNRWVQLFNETVDGLFEGPKAEEAKWRAERMALMFWSKIKYHREQGSQPLIRYKKASPQCFQPN